MTFIDTGILVGALLEKHPQHDACIPALKIPGAFTNAHALAETFSSLTGFYKVPTEAASELTLSLADQIQVEPLEMADYKAAIRESRSRGVMGGGIYDSLHATFARRNGAVSIITRNPSHFAHVAPDMEILTP